MVNERILKVSRLEGLSDGVFAIAMTLLVLDLKLPNGLNAGHMAQFLETNIVEKLFVYAGSFIILGTLWVATNFQIGFIRKLSRPYLWAHIFYLMIVCIVPFSANLLASFPQNKASIVFYALNLLYVSIMHFIIVETAWYCNLNKSGFNAAIHAALLKRIAFAPIFYLTAMITANWSTRIAFIVLLIPTIGYMIPGRVDRFDKNESLT